MELVLVSAVRLLRRQKPVKGSIKFFAWMLKGGRGLQSECACAKLPA
jgi:hypothetical protein